MSREEWLKLNLGDYIYRADGWGGWLTTAPGKRELKDWNDTQSLSFKGFDETYSTAYPAWAKASEHELWQKMDVAKCTNALALAKYAVLDNNRIYQVLRSTTIL